MGAEMCIRDRLHVIACAVPVANVKVDPVGSTSAVPVIVTVPEEITTLFPTAVTLASALTVTLPIPRVTGIPVGLKLASPVIVTLPNPSVNALPVGISTIESAVIPGLPILIVNSFLVAVIVSLPSSATVEKGLSANAANPNSMVVPYLATTGTSFDDTIGNSAKAI